MDYFCAFLPVTRSTLIINISRPIVVCSELNLPFVLCVQTEIALCHAARNSAAERMDVAKLLAKKPVCLKVLV